MKFYVANVTITSSHMHFQLNVGRFAPFYIQYNSHSLRQVYVGYYL